MIKYVLHPGKQTDNNNNNKHIKSFELVLGQTYYTRNGKGDLWILELTILDEKDSREINRKSKREKLIFLNPWFFVTRSPW